VHQGVRFGFFCSGWQLAQSPVTGGWANTFAVVKDAADTVGALIRQASMIAGNAVFAVFLIIILYRI